MDRPRGLRRRPIVSRPGKRLAVLLTLLGAAFQWWFAPRHLPRAPKGLWKTGDVAPVRQEAPRPGHTAPASVRVETGGYATLVEDSPPGPRRRPGPAAARAPRAAARATPTAPAPRKSGPLPVRARRPSAPRRRRVRVVWMSVTAYCPCRKCCGRYTDGRTACGHKIRADGAKFVAADTRILPFGTEVGVPGYHQARPVPVLDRGRRIKGMRLDVFFLSHERARRWGTKWLPVTVYLD